MPAIPAWIRTRRPCRTPIRICSTKASSPARGSTTWTRSSQSLQRPRAGEHAALARSVRGAVRAGRRSSPTSRSSTTIRRACSRTRSGSTAGCVATGRSSGGCCPCVPTRAGWRRNRLPLIARWKIFDNLRRSLMAPATLAVLVAGWTILPGAADRRGPRSRLAAAAFPDGRPARRDARHVAAAHALARGLRGSPHGGGARRAAGRRFSPARPTTCSHAIVVTLVRVGLTHRRLARMGNGRGDRTVARACRALGVFVTRMIASPLLAVGALVAIAGDRSAALPIARARCCCCGPPRPRSRSRSAAPRHRRREVLDAGDRAYLSSRRARDLAVLRHVRRAGRPRVAARQRPDDARRARRAPDVAHEHRDGAAGHAVGARSGLHRPRRHGRRVSTRR